MSQPAASKRVTNRIRPRTTTAGPSPGHQDRGTSWSTSRPACADRTVSTPVARELDTAGRSLSGTMSDRDCFSVPWIVKQPFWAVILGWMAVAWTATGSLVPVSGGAPQASLTFIAPMFGRIKSRIAVASAPWGVPGGRCLRTADYVTLRGPADGAPAGTRVLELPTLWKDDEDRGKQGTDGGPRERLSRESERP